jgi:hypothetical protein
MAHNDIDWRPPYQEITAVIHVTDRTCFLENAIFTARESALRAGRTQLEVSCNSTNSETRERVEEICGSLGVTIRHKSAGSFFEHLEASTVRCATKYIVLLHDDDYVDVEFFSEIRRLTQNYPKASAFGVATAYDICNTIHRPAFRGAHEFWISPLVISALYMARRSGPAFPSLAYKRDFLLTQLPPPDLLGICGDVHVVSKCAEAGMIISTNPLFYYRLHSMNMSRGIDWELRTAVIEYSAKMFFASLGKHFAFRDFWSNILYLAGCFFKRRTPKAPPPVPL